MKNRLIANGVLSLLGIFHFFVFFDWILLPSFVSWISWCVLTASFIMGICTLAMKKHPSVHGLTIASGILALFGGFGIVNAIVSFIAVSKINKL